MIGQTAPGDSPGLVHNTCVKGCAATRGLYGIMILRFDLVEGVT